METDNNGRYQVVRDESSDRLSSPVLQLVGFLKSKPQVFDTVLNRFIDNTGPTRLAKTFDEWLKEIPLDHQVTVRGDLQATRCLYFMSMVDYLRWTNQIK